MKKTIPTLMLLLLTAACTGKKEPVVVAELDDEDEPLPERFENDDLPKAADELFDDFFYYYASNASLQHRRTVFPLPVKGADGKNGLDKKRIAAHIKEKFGERAEVNERENFTSTGLPLADTHFVVKDGKRKCFLYVYEGNSVLILLNTAEGNCEELAKRHKNVVRSAFPKSKDSWYAVVMDKTIGEEEALAIIDKAAEESLQKL